MVGSSLRVMVMVQLVSRAAEAATGAAAVVRLCWECERVPVKHTCKLVQGATPASCTHSTKHGKTWWVYKRLLLRAFVCRHAS